MERRYSITYSEWAVLRIILDKYPIGSKEIIEKLQDQNDWSVATIKTFLSRMVSKNTIGYTKEKNSFNYFPKVTEMTFVRDEMKSFFSKIYGDSIHYETEHFLFAGHNDFDHIRYLGVELEKYYSKISSDLNIKLDKKQLIYLYSTQKAFYSALGYEEGPIWLTAGWFWEIVHLAPKECYSGPHPEAPALHVFTQLIVHYINPRAPFWLIQGVSVYESGWLTFDKIKQVVCNRKNDLDAYSIFRIPLDDDLFKINDGYELTYTFIEYIVITYGKETLIDYIKSPDLIRSIFSCTEEEFWSNWVKFVISRYMGVENQ